MHSSSYTSVLLHDLWISTRRTISCCYRSTGSKKSGVPQKNNKHVQALFFTVQAPRLVLISCLEMSLNPEPCRTADTSSFQAFKLQVNEIVLMPTICWWLVVYWCTETLNKHSFQVSRAFRCRALPTHSTRSFCQTGKSEGLHWIRRWPATLSTGSVGEFLNLETLRMMAFQSGDHHLEGTEIQWNSSTSIFNHGTIKFVYPFLSS